GHTGLLGVSRFLTRAKHVCLREATLGVAFRANAVIGSPRSTATGRRDVVRVRVERERRQSVHGGAAVDNGEPGAAIRMRENQRYVKPEETRAIVSVCALRSPSPS